MLSPEREKELLKEAEDWTDPDDKKDFSWDYIVGELGKKHAGDIPAKEIILVSAIGRLVKNKNPYSFNLIVHAPSSAGKDHLVESVLKLFAKEDIEAFGRISKTALTYLHDSKKEPFFSYDGKILYLEEITEEVLNNEIMKVFTAGLTKSAITKDQKAEVIEVEGKPVVICTTATTKPNPEILNRFSIVTLDESKEQTKRTFLHEKEEYDPNVIKFLSGLKEREIKVSKTMKDKIANHFPNGKTDFRRTFQKFLDIMRAITLFHKRKSSNWEDYDLAVRVFSNYRSGIASIPLKKEDKKIVEILEKSAEPLSARDIMANMKGILSQAMIYRHLDNLNESDILVSFHLRDAFNNPIKKYMVSDEMKDKNPLKLLNSAEM